MTGLREDVRSAFERDQSALGDVRDVRQRLMQNALGSPKPASHRVQWAAGIAAVLIAAIVIATFALTRAAPSLHPIPAASPSPKAQATPTPLANQLSVPATTPVILYHDPANFDQVDGVTWDGKTSGRVGLGAANGGIGDPYGHYYATMSEIRDRTGNFVAPQAAKSSTIFWADDGIHFCDVVRSGSADASGPGMLRIGQPGRPMIDVAPVGTFGSAGSNAGGPVIVACSPSGDRAVVYQAGGQGVGVAHFWVIQLSTGRTLWSGGSGTWISASHDGQYVALGSGSTTVYGPTGEDLAHLGDEVFAFSWDDRLAVTAVSFGAQPSVIDWRTGQTIWTCPNSAFKYWQAFAEPGGSHLAIGVLDPKYPQTGGFAPVDLFVVGADGVTVFERQNITLFSQ